MRKLLSEILRDGQSRLQDAWSHTQAAEDYGTPLPSGEYIARIVSGELFNSRTKGTGGYKLCFRVLEGDHQGRQFWHDIYLTEAALPMAKRDLAKLGITRLDQLETPLPEGIRCKVKLALRKDDDGTEYNRVKHFEVVGIDPPEVDPFTPKVESSGGSSGTLPPANATGAADGDEDKPLAAANAAGGEHDDF